MVYVCHIGLDKKLVCSYSIFQAHCVPSWQDPPFLHPSRVPLPPTSAPWLHCGPVETSLSRGLVCATDRGSAAVYFLEIHVSQLIILLRYEEKCCSFYLYMERVIILTNYLMVVSSKIVLLI